MILKEIIKELELSVYCGDEPFDVEVNGGYASDLLSNVIANSKKSDVWITIQIHSNIVAVAVLKELAAIIIVQGREPANDTVRRAKEEKVPILVSKLSTFEVVGKLYQLGIGAAK
jgi:serine kinase of HPr protein (carbohydrate metabolism regulator)